MSTTRWVVAVLAAVGAADLVVSSALVTRAAPALARRPDGTVRGPLVWVWTALVLAYRAASSGRVAGGGVGVCRFEPSCSAYALEAVRSYGGVRGGVLVAYRLLRCQPLSKGGFDPVPTRRPAGGPKAARSFSPEAGGDTARAQGCGPVRTCGTGEADPAGTPEAAFVGPQADLGGPGGPCSRVAERAAGGIGRSRPAFSRSRRDSPATAADPSVGTRA